MIFNTGQLNAIEKAKKWYKEQINQVFEITGPAGSGKTTLIIKIIEELGLDLHRDCIFVAYTGQASLVLRQKGVPAFTIHSTIYDLVMMPLLDENKNIVVNQQGKVIKVPKFILKSNLNENLKLIVVDEASMVPEEIKKDLLSFNIPTIALGDLDQLPPVMGKPSFLISPDVYLTEIMRQNEGNPIIHLSELARNGENIPLGKYGNKCYVISENQVNDKMMLLSEAIICGKNKTRNEINKYIREEVLRYEEIIPRINEKMICRKNNWNLSLQDEYFMVNGLQGSVFQPIDLSRMTSNSFFMDFKPFFLNDIFSDIKIDLEYLYKSYIKGDSSKSINREYSNGNLFEYAYAITCHLSQGSQYKSVLLFEEVLDYKTHKNWLYTGITRAVDFLILVKKERKYY